MTFKVLKRVNNEEENSTDFDVIPFDYDSMYDALTMMEESVRRMRANHRPHCREPGGTVKSQTHDG